MDEQAAGWDVLSDVPDHHRVGLRSNLQQVEWFVRVVVSISPLYGSITEAMKLCGPPTPVRRPDETANTTATERFTRKQRLIRQLEDVRYDGRDPWAVVTALVTYIDDDYVEHLVRRIQLP